MERQTYPPEPDWRCVYCGVTVKGGTTHHCPK